MIGARAGRPPAALSINRASKAGPRARKNRRRRRRSLCAARRAGIDLRRQAFSAAIFAHNCGGLTSLFRAARFAALAVDFFWVGCGLEGRVEAVGMEGLRGVANGGFD